MFVIETELGRFEAETERDAKKALKKAQKDRQEREEALKGYRDRAHSLAAERGYLILHNKLSGQRQCFEVAAPNTPCAPRIVREEGLTYNSEHATYTLSEGDVTIRHYGYSVVGGIVSPSGYTVGVFLRDHTTGAVDGYAIGQCEGEWSFLPLPTVTPEDFGPT